MATHMRRVVFALSIVYVVGASTNGCTKSKAPPTQCMSDDAAAPILAVATVSALAPGPAVPLSFVGFGLEPGELATFTGSVLTDLNPLFTQLLGNFVPLNGAPILRVGGNKQDTAWWDPGPHPQGTDVALTPSDIESLDRSVSPSGVKVIFGLNLRSADPALAIAEAKGVLAAMPAEHLVGFEIGNEPDLYPSLGARPATYSIDDYSKEVAAFIPPLRAAIGPAVPFVGASFTGPFVSSLPTFVATDGDLLSVVTLHHYPLSACPGAPAEVSPSLEHLLSDNAATANPRAVAPLVADAHAHHLPVRIDELNSVVCHGADGVSNTFASALWILDLMFEYASVGVDGVNVHAHPEGEDFYRPFGFDYDAAAHAYRAHVYPIYHGMFLFAEAVQHGARLLPVTVTTESNVKVWATLDDQETVRVIIISKAPNAAGTVVVSGVSTKSPAHVVRLVAPDVSAKAGVSLGGQTFEDTPDGKAVIASPDSCTIATIAPTQAGFRVPISGAMAAMLTFDP